MVHSIIHFACNFEFEFHLCNVLIKFFASFAALATLTPPITRTHTHSNTTAAAA